MKKLHTLGKTPEDTSRTGDGKTLSEDGRYVSEEEYWENYYNHPDFSYEWKNGYLEERPVSDFKGSLVYQWFSDILRRYFQTFPAGKIVNLEIGFRLALPGDISIRKPDTGIVLNSNPAMLNPEDCNFEGIFDLCVESLSYSKQKEIIRDTVEKKKEYQGIGVREYYILDARGKETAFYRLGEKGRYRKIRPADRDVIQSGILPGFQFRISDLYRQPSLEEMSGDAVYSGFVLPFHQQIRKLAESETLRAEAEKKRAETERQRAEQAEQRAALLADKLKELGIVI
jgi:Uma2 family endonuclease